MRFGVPLKVAMGMFEYTIQLITLQFIGGEKSKVLGIVDEGLIEKVADGDHARLFRSGRHTKFLPIWDFEGYKSGVRFLPLSHSELLVFGDDAGDNLLW